MVMDGKTGWCNWLPWRWFVRRTLAQEAMWEAVTQIDHAWLKRYSDKERLCNEFEERFRLVSRDMEAVQVFNRKLHTALERGGQIPVIRGGQGSERGVGAAADGGGLVLPDVGSDERP